MTLPPESMSEEEYNLLPGIRSTALKYKNKWGSRAYNQKQNLKLFGEQKETDPLRFGNILHEVLIEDRRNWDVWEGGVRNGKHWDAFKEMCEIRGKSILLPKEHQELSLMIDSVSSNKEAMKLLERTVRKEQVIQFDYRGMPCKVKLDLWLDDNGQADIKSSQNASCEGFFFKGITKFGYDIQSEFYKLGVQYYLEDDSDLPFHFIVVENKEPYRCAVHQIHPEVAALARSKMFKALDEIAECEESGHWPEPLAEDEDGKPITHMYSPSMYWYENNGATFDD